MSEPVETQLLRSLLRQARAASRRRTALRVLLDGVTVTVAATVVGALVAGWTLRGDLAARGWSVVVLGTLLGLVTHALVRGRRALGSDLRTARAIAHHPAPLGRADSPARLREHRLLRHEILGATELADQLAAGSSAPVGGSPASPPPTWPTWPIASAPTTSSPGARCRARAGGRARWPWPGWWWRR